MWDADRIHQNVICSHATVFANKACQQGALSILMKTMLQIWWPDSNNNMKARQQGVLKDVALCLRSVRVWFDKRSGGWCREKERERERKGAGKRERARESWLKWRVPGWREPVRDKAPAKPRPLEQLFLHAAFGLVQWKEAYVWPGATLPPGWLQRIQGETRREAEGEKEND